MTKEDKRDFIINWSIEIIMFIICISIALYGTYHTYHTL